MFSFHTVALEQQEGLLRLSFLILPLTKELLCLWEGKAKAE
jgi:hypothetical protein